MTEKREPIMPFGQHKGTLVKNMPRDDIEWLLKNFKFKRPDDWLKLAMEDVLRSPQDATGLPVVDATPPDDDIPRVGDLGEDSEIPF